MRRGGEKAETGNVNSLEGFCREEKLEKNSRCWKEAVGSREYIFKNSVIKASVYADECDPVQVAN